MYLQLKFSLALALVFGSKPGFAAPITYLGEVNNDQISFLTQLYEFQTPDQNPSSVQAQFLRGPRQTLNAPSSGPFEIKMENYPEVGAFNFSWASGKTFELSGPFRRGANFFLGEVSFTNLPIADVRTSAEIPGWPSEKLVDGDLNSCWSSNSESSVAASHWIEIEFGYVERVDRIVLTPRVQGLGFPNGYSIEVWQNDSWQTVPGQSYVKHGRSSGDSFAHFFSPPLFAEKLRIITSDLGDDGYNFYFQLAEIQPQVMELP